MQLCCLNAEESVFFHEDYLHRVISSKSIGELKFFVFMSTFLRPPVAKELHRILCLIFGVERKFFCMFSHIFNNLI